MRIAVVDVGNTSTSIAQYADGKISRHAHVTGGILRNRDACAEALLSVTETIEPDPEIAARYEKQYRKFSRIYPALKGVFPELR